MNKLPEARHKTLLEVFFRQFLNPLIYVLLAAAAVSCSLGTQPPEAFFLAWNALLFGLVYLGNLLLYII